MAVDNTLLFQVMQRNAQLQDAAARQQAAEREYGFRQQDALLKQAQFESDQKQKDFENRLKLAELMGKAGAYDSDYQAPSVDTREEQQYMDVGRALGGFDMDKLGQARDLKEMQLALQGGIADQAHLDRLLGFRSADERAAANRQAMAERAAAQQRGMWERLQATMPVRWAGVAATRDLANASRQQRDYALTDKDVQNLGKEMDPFAGLKDPVNKIDEILKRNTGDIPGTGPSEGYVPNLLQQSDLNYFQTPQQKKDALDIRQAMTDVMAQIGYMRSGKVINQEEYQRISDSFDLLRHSTGPALRAGFERAVKQIFDVMHSKQAHFVNPDVQAAYEAGGGTTSNNFFGPSQPVPGRGAPTQNVTQGFVPSSAEDDEDDAMLDYLNR